MKFLIYIFIIIIADASSLFANPITIRINTKVDELTTKSGVVYKNATILRIEKKGVAIMHTRGARMIPAAELPEYQFLFDRIKEPDTKTTSTKTASDTTATKLQVNRKNTWVPKSIDDVKKTCLVIRVTKQIARNGSAVSDDKAVVVGSGFLCNIGGTSYIYSNARYFFGAKEFKIEHDDGREIDHREFVDVQLAKGHAGHCKKSNLGSDVIRIRLRSFHPKALRLDNFVISKNYDMGRSISVIGANKRATSIDHHIGTLYSIESHDVFAHSAAPEISCSGGAIVDNHSFKLIGMQSWRQRPTHPVEIIWKQRRVDKELKWSTGVSLARMQFTKSSLDSLYEEKMLMGSLMTNIRMLGLLDAIEPHKDGILINTSRRVMGDYTIKELLEKHPNHYIVRSLKSLDIKLRRNSSNLGISNQDVWKAYRTTYRGALSYSAKVRSQVGNACRYKSQFFKDELDKLKLLEICHAYEKWIVKSLSWFERQLGTSGDAMPLGHPGLPSINGGLDALAIKSLFKSGDDEQNSEAKKKELELEANAKQFREEEDARITREQEQTSQRIWDHLAAQHNKITLNGGRADSPPSYYGGVMSDSDLFQAQNLHDEYNKEAKKLGLRFIESGAQQEINSLNNLNNRR